MSWRDIHCGDVRREHVGKRLTVAGWVDTRRDHGGLVFVDLRDEGGVLQLVINPANAAAAAGVAHELRNEFVVRARGAVVARAGDAAVRRAGEAEQVVALDELAATLAG